MTNYKFFMPLVAGTLISGAALAARPNAASELILSGPIESVDYAKNTLSILGHSLRVRDASAFHAGSVANVFGQVTASGNFAPSLLSDTGAFASGVESVLIRGRVSSVDLAVGRMTVDGASVDYTALLSTREFSVPNVGAIVRIAGTQPNRKGVVLATQVAVRPTSVSGGGHSASVSGGGQASSVSGGGHSASVSGGGQASSVSGGGQASSVSGGGHSASVSGGGQASSVSGGGAQ